MRNRIQELVTYLSYRKRLNLEIQDLFETNERTVRLWISDIAKEYPVISPSKDIGYKIATNESDIRAVFHQLKENQSRADKILERNKPLMRFAKKAAKLHGCSLVELERRYT